MTAKPRTQKVISMGKFSVETKSHKFDIQELKLQYCERRNFFLLEFSRVGILRAQYQVICIKL